MKIREVSMNEPLSRSLQRLLYLQARTPSVFSEIIGLTLIEPIKGYQAEITAIEEEWSYVTVHGTWQHIAPQVSKQLAAVTDL
jgi:hypothetical protein